MPDWNKREHTLPNATLSTTFLLFTSVTLIIVQVTVLSLRSSVKLLPQVRIRKYFSNTSKPLGSILKAVLQLKQIRNQIKHQERKRKKASLWGPLSSFFPSPSTSANFLSLLQVIVLVFRFFLLVCCLLFLILLSLLPLLLSSSSRLFVPPPPLLSPLMTPAHPPPLFLLLFFLLFFFYVLIFLPLTPWPPLSSSLPQAVSCQGQLQEQSCPQ